MRVAQSHETLEIAGTGRPRTQADALAVRAIVITMGAPTGVSTIRVAAARRAGDEAMSLLGPTPRMTMSMVIDMVAGAVTIVATVIVERVTTVKIGDVLAYLA